MTREDLADMIPDGGVAIELGVAKGDYSVALLERNPGIRILYSIDRWSDHHDDAEYRSAFRRLSAFGERSMVLRLTFEQAVHEFSDGVFDFIYVDGYAHTGQEGGRTLDDWWPKLKVGGIFAGHDYSARWPLTVKAVDAFVRERGLNLNVTDEVERGKIYRSWWVRK